MALAAVHGGGNASASVSKISFDCWTSTASSDVIVIAHLWATGAGPVPRTDGKSPDTKGNSYTLL